MSNFKSSVVNNYTTEKDLEDHRAYLGQPLVAEVNGETVLFIPPATERMMVGEKKERGRPWESGSVFRVYPLAWFEVEDFLKTTSTDTEEFLRARMACIKYAIGLYERNGTPGFTGCVINAINGVYTQMVALGHAIKAKSEIRKFIDELPNAMRVWEYLRLAPDIKAVYDREPRVAEFSKERWIADNGDAMLIFEIFQISPSWKMIGGRVYCPGELSLSDRQRVLNEPYRRLKVAKFGRFYDIDNHGTAWGDGLREDKGYGHFGKYPPPDAVVFRFNHSHNSNGDGYSWVAPNPFSGERLIAVAEGYCGAYWELSLPVEGFYPLDEDGYNIFVGNGWV